MHFNKLSTFAKKNIQGTLHFLLPPPQRFAVITRGRTGSNLLMSLLASHPEIRECGEVVGEWQLRERAVKQAILEMGPAAYMEHSFRRRGLESFLGVKMLYRNFERKYAERWGVKELPKVLDYLQAHRDIKIIHMKRRNRLRSLVSGKIAAHTKQFKLVDKKQPVKDIQLELSIKECAWIFERVEQFERKYEEIFRDHQYSEVYYEDLVAHRERECNRLLEYLGARRRPLKTRLLKQNKRSLPEVVRNYDALKSHFAGTEWGVYFED